MKMSALMGALLTIAASATPLCTAVTGIDVTTPGFSCIGGPLLFSNFELGAPAGTIVTLSSIGIGPLPSEYDLGFQVLVNAPADIVLLYAVDSLDSLTLIDGLSNHHNGHGATTIQEVGCSDTVALLANGTCPPASVVANFVNPPTGSATFAGLSSVGVYKDISIFEAGDLSSFINDHHYSQVPEPLSAALMGIGLIVLASVKRRNKV